MFRKFLPFILIGILAFVWFLLPSPTTRAQVSNGITSPEPGEVVAGVVLVEGTAANVNFLRYELAFMNIARPGTDWIVFSQGDSQVISDTLAVWDTTVGRETTPIYPDGPYQLRLRVVRNDYNYDEFLVTDLFVSNDTPTPTPTVDITATLEFTGTPTPAGVLVDPIIPTPNILPTLTPFPTPSPFATLADQPLGPSVQQSEPEQKPGLLGQFVEIDVGRFGRAFWTGAVIAAAVFTGLALYLIFRRLLRRIWRFAQTKLFR